MIGGLESCVRFIYIYIIYFLIILAIIPSKYLLLKPFRAIRMFLFSTTFAFPKLDLANYPPHCVAPPALGFPSSAAGLLSSRRGCRHGGVNRAVCGWNSVHITIQTGALTIERPSVPVSYNKSSVKPPSGDREAALAKWNNTDSSHRDSTAASSSSQVGAQADTVNFPSSHRRACDITERVTVQELNAWTIFTLRYNRVNLKISACKDTGSFISHMHFVFHSLELGKKGLSAWSVLIE